MNQSQAELIAALSRIVGDDKVKVDAESLSTFGKDWTKVYEPHPSAIVFPSSIEEVPEIVR